MPPVITTIVTFSIFYIILETVKRTTDIRSDFTRKAAHVGSAILVMIFYHFLSQKEFVISTSFFVITFCIFYATKFLKSIHLENQKTIGEILYPVSLVILGIFFYDNAFAMLSSVAVMGFADAASGLYNLKHKKDTFKGSVLFFFITIIILITSYLFFLGTLPILALTKLLIISLTITAAEHFTGFGTDNLSVPLLCAVLLGLLF